MGKEINTDMETQAEPMMDREVGLKYDKGKPRYSLIPPILTESVAKVLTFGAEKYAPNSWQTVPNAEERYLDALMRHLEAYRGGERVDEESGLTHLSHLATNVAFLLHFEEIEGHKARIIATAIDATSVRMEEFKKVWNDSMTIPDIQEQGMNCPECDVPTICSEVSSNHCTCKNNSCSLYNRLQPIKI